MAEIRRQLVAEALPESLHHLVATLPDVVGHHAVPSGNGCIRHPVPPHDQHPLISPLQLTETAPEPDLDLLPLDRIEGIVTKLPIVVDNVGHIAEIQPVLVVGPVQVDHPSGCNLLQVGRQAVGIGASYGVIAPPAQKPTAAVFRQVNPDGLRIIHDLVVGGTRPYPFDDARIPGTSEIMKCLGIAILHSFDELSISFGHRGSLPKSEPAQRVHNPHIDIRRHYQFSGGLLVLDIFDLNRI